MARAPIKRKKRGTPRTQTIFKIALAALVTVILVMTTALSIHYGWAWFKTAPIFTLREVKVQGAKNIDREWVIKASGIRGGENLLGLSTKIMEEAISSNAWVKKVQVERALPHALEIKIQERRPIAILKGDKRLYLLDEDGIPFKPLDDKGEKWRLFHVELDQAGGTTWDEKAQGLFASFVKAMDRWGKILCKKNIKEMVLHKDRFVVVTKDAEIPLVFSSRESIELQFRRAEKILYNLYASGKYKDVESVDLWVGESTAIAKIG